MRSNNCTACSWTRLSVSMCSGDRSPKAPSRCRSLYPMITFSGVRSSWDMVAVNSSRSVLAVRSSLTRLALSNTAAACTAMPLRMRHALAEAGAAERRAAISNPSNRSPRCRRAAKTAAAPSLSSCSAAFASASSAPRCSRTAICSRILRSRATRAAAPTLPRTAAAARATWVSTLGSVPAATRRPIPAAPAASAGPQRFPSESRGTSRIAAITAINRSSPVRPTRSIANASPKVPPHPAIALSIERQRAHANRGPVCSAVADLTEARAAKRTRCSPSRAPRLFRSPRAARGINPVPMDATQPAQSQSRASLWVMQCIEIRGSSLAWTRKLVPTRSFVVTRTRGRCRRARHVTHREAETELHLVLTPGAPRSAARRRTRWPRAAGRDARVAFAPARRSETKLDARRPRTDNAGPPRPPPLRQREPQPELRRGRALDDRRGLGARGARARGGAPRTARHALARGGGARGRARAARHPRRVGAARAPRRRGDARRAGRRRHRQGQEGGAHGGLRARHRRARPRRLLPGCDPRARAGALGRSLHLAGGRRGHRRRARGGALVRGGGLRAAREGARPLEGRAARPLRSGARGGSPKARRARPRARRARRRYRWAPRLAEGHRRPAGGRPAGAAGPAPRALLRGRRGSRCRSGRRGCYGARAGRRGHSPRRARRRARAARGHGRRGAELAARGDGADHARGDGGRPPGRLDHHGRRRRGDRGRRLRPPRAGGRRGGPRRRHPRPGPGSRPAGGARRRRPRAHRRAFHERAHAGPLRDDLAGDPRGVLEARRGCGMGFTWEADAHLHLKRAWLLEQALGTASRTWTRSLPPGGRSE